MLDSNQSLREELSQKIHSFTARIGIIGLGMVGLPTAYYWANKGYPVTGFDVSMETVNIINRGISNNEDIDTAKLYYLVKQQQLQATTNFSLLNDMDIIIICVPTPITKYKEPDLSFIQEASQTIAEQVTSGTLIILESTTYPGTTEEWIIPPLQEKGFTVGENIFVVYSPERIDPANQEFNLSNTTKVVGGYTPICAELATTFIGDMAYTVSSLKVAEMSKVYENTFRFINMSFVNETTILCNKLGIDIWEVINASTTKPYGFLKFTPWIGVGGHCIPVDPYYLTYKAREYGKRTKMIDLAGEINDQMVEFVYFRILEALNEKEILLTRAKIVVLGVTYKEDIADVRESPVQSLLSKLMTVNRLVVIDPYVEEITVSNRTIRTEPYRSNIIQQADLVIVATPHRVFSYKDIAKYASLILDTKNIFDKLDIHTNNIIKL